LASERAYYKGEGLLGLVFTPLGIRGIFGKDLTTLDVLTITNSFGRLLGEGSTVVLGRDTRSSSPLVSKAASAGLLSAGVNVINVGIAPTPTIEWAVDFLGADGGVIVSASHNPPEWNALKLLGERGILISPEDSKRIKEDYLNGKFGCVSWNEVGDEAETDVIGDYIAAILSLVDVDAVREAGLKVVLDPNGGAGSIVTPYLLREMKVELTTLNSVPGIFCRELEPRPDALGDLANLVRAINADVGFAHDTDADRLALVTEKGEVVPEDVTLALVVEKVLKERRGGTLVVNIASSRMFDDLAEKYGGKIVRVPVGEVYVARKMLELSADVGGEGSCGGVIYPELHYGRDGPLAAAMILERLAKEGKRLSELIAELPQYVTMRGSVSGEVNWGTLRETLLRLSKEMSIVGVSELDGIRLDSEDFWVLVRPSRTEPKIRIVVEAKDKSTAEKLFNKFVKIVRDYVS